MRRLGLVLIGVGCDSEVGQTPLCTPALMINEVAAANEVLDLVPTDTFADFCATHGNAWCCESPDWIELYNPGDGTVDLAGHWISVDVGAPRKPFPTTEVPRRGFALVIATPYTPDDDGCAAELALELPGVPTVFGGTDLDRDGWGITLLSPDHDICDELYYPDQHANAAWARVPDGGGSCVDALPTPGAPNLDSPVNDERFECSDF